MKPPVLREGRILDPSPHSELAIMDLPLCSPAHGLSLAAAFNRDCRCIIVGEPALANGLKAALPAQDRAALPGDAHASLFSATGIFLAREDVDRLRSMIYAIERVIVTPSFQTRVLGYADAIARIDHGPHGVCMGYDFHLTDAGPKLIEINTNAGGILLNGVLARAARTCCKEAEQMAVGCWEPQVLDDIVVDMFRRDWQSQRGDGRLETIAIVDDEPNSQYLALEFRLFQELFKRHGLEAVIADASALQLRDGHLYCGTTHIDLVYNRLTDFGLQQPEHKAMREAYATGVSVVTPNPHIYSLYADKRNLILLADQAFLKSAQLQERDIATLASGIPQTLLLTPELAPRFWTERNRWFFKPVAGFGSRAAYRGDKVTKRVFQEIAQGGYIAQARVEPSKRTNPQTGADPLKVDLRCYVYQGHIQLMAARLYQGQTTNFRTPGGGFAPVFYAWND